MSKLSVAGRCLLLLAMSACWSLPQAEVTAEALKQQIQERSGKIKEFRAMLNDPDQTVRLAALDEWGGIYTFNVKTFDEKTGQFATTGTYRNGTGQLNGTRVEFTQPYCNGTFKLGDGAVLEGELGCKGSWAGTFEGQIRLQ